ncbi:Zinc finger, RING-type [Sesbania bispinosa]|nr:Zinc finger, RING-type [Sesbania bispinosa]
MSSYRMCRALMPGDDENLTDEAVWETLPHFWISISMVFFIAATVFTLLKITGDVAALGWWDLFINFGGDIPRSYTSIASKSRDCFGFLHRGPRLLGWWSIDEGSKEEEARLYCAGSSGYNTFSPDTVKKMPRADLVEEEKILCRVCFEEQINVVLLPCKHHILCHTCCEKCKRCPVCRGTIEERMPVYDV